VLAMQAERIERAAREGRLRNGHTFGTRTHAVVVDDVDADVGKRKVAVCGKWVVVAVGEPLFGCGTCHRMLASVGVSSRGAVA
jgi:hypothetical protein